MYNCRGASKQVDEKKLAEHSKRILIDLPAGKQIPVIVLQYR
ncbi:MAG: hypothetical protein OFPII_41810 [Osedax symbiont Rs1]|nr:MAG: hypothetical protein OFPII_41810 [Osedax symbiont Rs1]